MRNAIKQAPALKPRSGIILPDHVSIKLHEQSGSTVAYTGKLNGTGFSGSFSISAAPTWVDGGAKPPSSNTTVKGVAAASSHPELLSVLTPPANGGLIFLWSYYMTAYTNNAGSPSILLQFGNMVSGGDGYRVGVSQGSNHNVIAQFRGVGEGAASQATALNNTLSSRQTVQQYIKTTDGALAAYSAVNGNWSSAGAATTTGSFSHTAPAGFDGVSLFTNQTSGPTSGVENMNRGATDDKILSDLLIVVDGTGALLAEMPEIASEHAQYFREKLWALDNK